MLVFRRSSMRGSEAMAGLPRMDVITNRAGPLRNAARGNDQQQREAEHVPYWPLPSYGPRLSLLPLLGKRVRRDAIALIRRW